VKLDEAEVPVTQDEADVPVTLEEEASRSQNCCQRSFNWI